MLAAGRTLADVMAELNVKRSTLFEWRRREDFQEYLRGLEEDHRRMVLGAFAQRGAQVAEAMVQRALDPQENGAVAVGAAKVVLESMGIIGRRAAVQVNASAAVVGAEFDPKALTPEQRHAVLVDAFAGFNEDGGAKAEEQVPLDGLVPPYLLDGYQREKEPDHGA